MAEGLALTPVLEDDAPEEELIDPSEYERTRTESERLRREHKRLYKEYQRLSADFNVLRERIDESALQVIERNAIQTVNAAEQALSRQPLVTNLPRVKVDPVIAQQKRAAEQEEEMMAKRQKLAKEKAAAAQQQKEQLVEAELAELGVLELMATFFKLAKQPQPPLPDTEGEAPTITCMGEYDGETLLGQGTSEEQAQQAWATEVLIKAAHATTLEDARGKIKALKLRSMKKQ
eukprot:TRINITY_DN1881_c0_g1_i2.p1 TRINITY_DN1881_c0_g1~~TRINITY_DN1881_c0_g1_i2.p1  ORF type:complete len:256 (+),score=132.13 TRINITY_DN1881_c0_g1_i2:70-768(+)